MDFDKFDTIGLAKTVEILVREAVSPLSFNRDLKIQRRARREKTTKQERVWKNYPNAESVLINAAYWSTWLSA